MDSTVVRYATPSGSAPAPLPVRKLHVSGFASWVTSTLLSAHFAAFGELSGPAQVCATPLRLAGPHSNDTCH